MVCFNFTIFFSQSLAWQLFLYICCIFELGMFKDAPVTRLLSTATIGRIEDREKQQKRFSKTGFFLSPVTFITPYLQSH